jgi:hypothetical protein
MNSETKINNLYGIMGSNVLSNKEFDICYDLVDSLETKENPPKLSLIHTDPEHCCHICEGYTELTCAFDAEMNPHCDPSPCCGCGSCAEDV